MTNPGAERVSFAFLERFWADREAGKECGLNEYLELFPGHEEVVAREYLRALAEHRRAEVGDDVESSDENRLGPYRLIKELGRGGQGIVWLAEDTRLGRKVALKVLSGLGPDAEGHLARFRREAELAYPGPYQRIRDRSCCTDRACAGKSWRGPTASPGARSLLNVTVRFPAGTIVTSTQVIPANLPGQILTMVEP